MLGQTINIMTLGGLALAVGILVDDATVTIENIERQMATGKELVQAILDGAEQIAIPALVSTLSISIVFVPMFSSPEWPAICSSRWPKRLSSRCWRRTSFHERWYRR
jgi:multidrug efflux pump subunit AcrB